MGTGVLAQQFGNILDVNAMSETKQSHFILRDCRVTTFLAMTSITISCLLWI